ncbi:MAG TPA: DUF1080 domain-containing protein [Opitutaceae bacterium]|nr:DUF1080 domain-containing protein [Opitutaceae bacterium]
MKTTLRHFLIRALIAVSFPVLSHAVEPGFESLFNGKDLSGWDGMPGFWSVRDEAITGQTTAEKGLKANTFIVWQGGEVKNFELRLSFRLLADNTQARANSGIQYRSKILDAATWVVGGYQCDMDYTRPYLGMLYEEKGRGIMMKAGERIRILPAGADGKMQIESAGTPTDPAELVASYRKGDWNEMIIIARSNHFQHFVNGKLTAEATDLDDAKAAKSGVLAFQLHTGPPMTIQFKDIRLKVLP